MGLQSELDKIPVADTTNGETNSSVQDFCRSNSGSPALDLSPQAASARGSSPGADASTSSVNSTSKIKVHWSTLNTQRLLNVVVQHTPDFKKSKVQKDVWNSIASIMRDEYLLEVSGEHCYNKWKNLRRDMRQHRDNPTRNSKNTGLYDEVAQLEDVIHTGGGRCGGGARLALETLSTVPNFPSQVYTPEALNLAEDTNDSRSMADVQDIQREEAQDLSRVEEPTVENGDINGNEESTAMAANQYQQLINLYLTAAYGANSMQPDGSSVPNPLAALMAAQFNSSLAPPAPTPDAPLPESTTNSTTTGSTAALMQQLSSPRKRKAHCRQLVRQLMEQEQAALQHAVSEHNTKMARLEEMLEVLNA